MTSQATSGTLFPLSQVPEGFVYHENFLSESEETDLLREIGHLDFKAFDFQGFTAKRRVVEYGFEYDFSTRKAETTRPISSFLLPIRVRAAQIAELLPESLVEAIVTEYPPGAPIGWHRDAPQFGTVVGISLGSACRMRFRPYASAKKAALKDTPRSSSRPVSVELLPRSIYVISGPARWRFQHSIPPVEQLRYSITFRTLRSPEKNEAA